MSANFRRVLLAVLAVVLVGAVFSGQILYALGALLVNTQPPTRADVVVFIGGDAKGNRVLKAAELVREGYAPLVFVSGVGGMYGHFESELAVAFAVSHGAPREAFIASRYPALSTLDEARDDLREVRRRGFHHYILVTNEYHTARAGRIFRREAPDLQAEVVAAPEPYWGNGQWWKEREGRKLWFNEFVKTIAGIFGI